MPCYSYNHLSMLPNIPDQKTADWRGDAKPNLAGSLAVGLHPRRDSVDQTKGQLKVGCSLQRFSLKLKKGCGMALMFSLSVNERPYSGG